MADGGERGSRDHGDARTRMTRADIWSDRLVRIVRGHATTADIESWVASAWNAGEILRILPRETVGKLPTAGRPVTRYGDSGMLRSEICFTHAHGPGAVVVHTPRMNAWNHDGRTTYCIAPHVHRHDHLTVVLQGRCAFFVARRDDRDHRVDQVAVRPGYVLFCPSGVAHTFGSCGEAFTVLSIQARFIEPSHRHFASNVSGAEALPFVI